MTRRTQWADEVRYWPTDRQEPGLLHDIVCTNDPCTCEIVWGVCDENGEQVIAWVGS